MTVHPGAWKNKLEPMSRNLIIAVAAVAAAGLVGAFFYLQAKPAVPGAGGGTADESRTFKNDEPGHSNDRPDESRGSVEAYVRENISTLSPEPAVLGGTLFVTNIEAGNGMGVVEYEDGHNAFTADFAYSLDEAGKVTIDSFKVRE